MRDLLESADSDCPVDKLLRYRSDARDSRPPFWSLVAVNLQIHAEAAGMVTGLNAVRFRYAFSTECFRREHPLPFPEAWVWKYPPRPERDFEGVKTMVLDIELLHYGRSLENSTVLHLAQRIRPFKELQTLFLMVRQWGRWELRRFDELVGDLLEGQVLEAEVDEFFSFDTRQRKERGRVQQCAGALRVRFMGEHGAFWACGIPVAEVRAALSHAGNVFEF